MIEKDYTPALGYSFLTPFYDLMVGLLTRENTWRSKIIEYLNPVSGERILDVGCGTGSLILKIKRSVGDVDMHGIDPDSKVLEIARNKLLKHSLSANLHHGFLTTEASNKLGLFSKVVSTLVFHQTPLEEKRNLLESVRLILEKSGTLYIADYGEQRSTLMKILFRCVIQALDGYKDTQANAEGCIPRLLKEVGFVNVIEIEAVPTLTGSISIYTAQNA